MMNISIGQIWLNRKNIWFYSSSLTLVDRNNNNNKKLFQEPHIEYDRSTFYKHYV